MGYTHYFRQTRDLTFAEWANLTKAVDTLIKAARDVPVRFEYDSSDPPLLSDDMIRFNGVGDDGHETFILERIKQAKLNYETQSVYDNEGAFSFCKTARKPYDFLVTASLLAAQHITGGAWNVSSDGDPTDWEDGKFIVEKELGFNITNEFNDIFISNE